MRPRLPSTQSSGHLLISEVSIPLNSLHELSPILLSLQHIYREASLREEVLDHLSHRLTRGNNTQGRPGLSLWEILVLGVVRLGLSTNYASLCDLANHHYLLRGILGVLPASGTLGPKRYKLSTLKETVAQLDGSTLDQINTLVVKTGHRLMGKKNRAQRRFTARFKDKG